MAKAKSDSDEEDAVVLGESSSDESSSSVSSGEGEEADYHTENTEALKRQSRRHRKPERARIPKLVGDEEVRAEGDVSSDEEHERNTIGNVPLHWYDEFDHIGYDKKGQMLMRKSKGDAIDEYLASKDDPMYRRTVYDAVNDQSTVLTDRELVMVRRLMESKFPEAGMNAEPDYVDYFSSQKMIMPLSGAPEPKRRFIPSKWERMKVMKLVNGIREGRLQIGKKPAKEKPEFFLMWGDDDTVDSMKKRRGAPKHIPAPKVDLPDHRESYHPPEEYLPTEEEVSEWLEAHEDDRKVNFLPQDFTQMRKVPAYERFIRERFERCMDLYLCPRVNKTKLNIDPESLVPKLPSPNELRPYPTTVAVTYFGHRSRVRTIAVDPTGELLASGGDDQAVCIWEISSGRCLARYNFAKDVKNSTAEPEAEEATLGSIVKVAWNPQPQYRVLAVALSSRVVLLGGGISDCVSEDQATETFKLLSGALKPSQSEDGTEADDTEDNRDEDELSEEAKKRKAMLLSEKIASWIEDGEISEDSIRQGKRCSTSIVFGDDSQKVTTDRVIDLCWHAKGEYLATVRNTERSADQITIHHVTKRLSQQPIVFKKDYRVQRVLFHPTKPIFFVATKRFVNVYHLVKQTRMRQLKSESRWISNMALHPKGDNLILSTYDRRVVWIDLEMSDRPWKILKYHGRAVRGVDFHRRYPLMASAADDGVVHVFHARVSDDFAKDPFVVPLKVLKGHTPTLEGLGVFQCVFHPTQPWVFSAGADGRIQLFQNVL